ncbi:MAG TPA: IS1 family transposase [Herpetosiphonaceae bacterium]
MPRCPRCQSESVIKNGHIQSGQPKFACKQCGRQFVEASQQRLIPPETKALVDKLLLERVSLAGIVRVTGVSARWLQYYVNQKYEGPPRRAEVPVKKSRLTIQCDELWSFVGKKAKKYWVWLALDVETRLIVGCFIGARDEAGAQGLWQSLPAGYRQCAVWYTDFWRAYAKVLPSKRHHAVSKQSGKTSLIERFNNTLRQRCSRLVRETLSCSKKGINHIGAVWFFIHDYNARQLGRLATATTRA